GEFELALDTSGRPAGEAIATLPGGGFVILDTETTPELEAEGLARDMIRAVQDARKKADFDVSDRLRLYLRFESADDAAVFPTCGGRDEKPNTVMLMTETLATFFDAQVRTEGADVSTREAWEQAYGFQPEFVNVVTAGTYANAGDVTIAVARQEAGS